MIAKQREKIEAVKSWEQTGSRKTGSEVASGRRSAVDNQQRAVSGSRGRGRANGILCPVENEMGKRPKTKLAPINKRWPGQWKTRSVIYDPTGCSSLWETDLSPVAAKEILRILAAEVSKPESAPTPSREIHEVRFQKNP